MPLTIHDLPLEILSYILKLALPAPRTHASWPVRSANLRSTALVCSAFRSAAQQLLIQHPICDTAEQLGLLQTRLEKLGHAEGGSSRTLWGGNGARVLHGGLVMNLLPLCTNLRTLYLHSVNALVLGELARCSTLQELHCFKCTFVEADTRRQAVTDPSFPSLRAIHLDGTQLASYPSITALPRLRTLSLHNPALLSFAHPNPHAVDEQSSKLTAFVFTLAPQLITVSFSPSAYMAIRLMHHFDKFTSLRFIDLSHGAFLSNRPCLLDPLTALTTLRIQDTYVETERVQALLATQPSARRRVIVVTGGPASPGLLSLLASGIAQVSLELKPTREGELQLGAKVSKQDEWMDRGFWEAVEEVDRSLSA